MKDVIKVLEKGFNTLESVKTSREFPLVLADYVRFIEETPELKTIIEKLVKDKKKKLQEMAIYEAKSLKELAVSKNKLLTILKKHNLSFPELGETFRELKICERDGIITDVKKSEQIYDYLVEIARSIAKTNYKNLLKNFIETRDGQEYLVFSKALQKRKQLDYFFTKLREKELWGHWDYLKCIFVLVSRTKALGVDFLDLDLETQKEIAKIHTDIKKELGFGVKDIVRIKNDVLPETDTIVSSVYLRCEKYKSYATRIHNYLFQELYKQELHKNENKSNTSTDRKKAKYKNGVLRFRDKDFDFNGKANQKELLDIIFQEPKKNWFYDEIQEKWDILKGLNLIKFPNDYWRKFYNAGDDINTAIAVEIQIKDFIVKDTKQIRINKKYT